MSLRGSPALFAAALAMFPCRAASPPVELSPMIGVRNGVDLDSDTPGVAPATSGASATLGLDVDVAVRPDGWFEAFLDHQSLSYAADPSAFGTGRFDVAVDYLQFGGRYEPEGGRTRPFVAASLGLTRFGASPGDVSHSIGFSGSLGGGVKVPVGKRVALRFEVRGYGTLSDAAVAVACGPGCVIGFSGSGWYQVAARAGVSIRLQ